MDIRWYLITKITFLCGDYTYTTCNKLSQSLLKKLYYYIVNIPNGMAITAGKYLIRRNSATTATEIFILINLKLNETQLYTNVMAITAETRLQLPLIISHSQKLKHHCNWKYFIRRKSTITATENISITETQAPLPLELFHSQKLNHNFH